MKINRFFQLSLVAALAVSCVAEKAEPVRTDFPGAEEITAGIEMDSPATKTYAEDLKVLWSAGDFISVFPKMRENSKYVLKSEPGKTYGTFTKDQGPLTGRPYAGYAAVYPYADDVALASDGTITLTMPAEQTYAENTFGPGANTMVSWSSTGYLPFKNLGGYFVMPVTGNVEINSIEFVGGAKEILAGKATVVPGKEGPVLTFDKEATDTSIVLTCPEPVKLDAETPTEFWIVVPAASYGMGVYVKVTYNGDQVFQGSPGEKTVNIVRSEIFRMETLDITVEEEDPNLIPADQCVDLKEPLTWPTNQPWVKPNFLLSSTYPELTKGEWVWDETGIKYPLDFPAFTVEKNMNRIRCVWLWDGLTLTIPALEIPEGSTLHFVFSIRTGGQAPCCWGVEACLDGENWVPMDLACDVEGSVNVNYKDPDEKQLIAPLFITAKDKPHDVHAQLLVEKAVKQNIVKVRYRVIDKLQVSGDYASAPVSVNNCHVYIPKVTKIDGFAFDGPTVFVR